MATTTTATNNAKQQQQGRCSSSPDLVMRIALLLGDDELEELNPSVWRRFRCNSNVNLDTFQDKILTPLLGWSRNYHTYYFAQNDVYYYQNQSSSADAFGLHDSYRAQGGRRVDPTKYKLGDLLRSVGDECYYAYDLGDHWYHHLVVEQVIHGNNNDNDDMFGKVTVLDGAMRCPDEDGEGGHRYQEQVLDLYNAMTENEDDIQVARKYATACQDRVNGFNVKGIFHADEFDVQKVQEEILKALQSRASFRMGNKQPYMPGRSLGQCVVDTQRLEPGQRKKTIQWEDSRGQETPRDPPFFMEVKEIVNIKPDDMAFALCGTCGNPNQLKECGRCHSVRYCSRECQKEGWTTMKHKKECKNFKAQYETYLLEKSGQQEPNNNTLHGERVTIQKFDPTNMRFKVGDEVECYVGPEQYGTGHVLKVLHEYDGITHAYQVQLDRATARLVGAPYNHAQIWADYDCDFQIRAARNSTSSNSSKPIKDGKKTARYRNMEYVD